MEYAAAQQESSIKIHVLVPVLQDTWHSQANANNAIQAAHNVARKLPIALLATQDFN
jgi:hypothetical protein